MRDAKYKMRNPCRVLRVASRSRKGPVAFEVHDSISDSFHIKELRRFKHGGLVKGGPILPAPKIICDRQRLDFWHSGFNIGGADNRNAFKKGNL
jgi:hypothetical protein